MSTAVTPIPERRDFFLSDECKIAAGGHGADDKEKCSGEMLAWILGIPHTASPPCVSRVLIAFIQRYNDTVDDEARNAVAWKLLCLRALGTADDGKDELRGYIAADWAVRVATPTWLELAGAGEAAAALRALPPITDRATRDQAYTTLRPISDAMWEKRSAARARLKEAVTAEVKKRLAEKPDADADAVAVAAADAVAVAAADADAVAVAVAVAVADAVAVAVADADAVADAVADADADAVAVAVAVADAAAVADAVADRKGYWATYHAVRKAVREVLQKRYTALIEEKYGAGAKSLQAASLEVFERMLDPTDPAEAEAA